MTGARAQPRDAGAPTADPLGARQRIIQVHPTLRCNLRCAHCYSDSSPGERVALPVEVLCAALSDAAALGYQAVAVSGGEPFLYPGLGALLRHAKACGLRTSVTTNGTLVDQRRLDQLVAHLDLLAISLDGPPAIHNELRQAPRAFERLERGLCVVRATSLPFGCIHTVTRRSWEHLLWTAAYAAEQGARLLQLHPLELTGRAADLLRDAVPDDDLLTRVYLLALALGAQYGERMAIQFDAFRTDVLHENPELVYAGDEDLAQEVGRRSAADLLGLLVVEADGTVVPISYGFSRAFRVCNLREQRLGEAWPAYVERGYRAFRALCRDVWRELGTPSALPFVDWHALIVARSHRVVEDG